MSRGLEIHRDLVFSEALVTALRNHEQLAGQGGRLLLVPSDETTERFLQRTVGGYLYLVVGHAQPDAQLNAAVQYYGDPPRQADLRLACAYRQDQGRVIISPAP
jgi:hypothetical protein